jgi:hypothetical protein
LVRGKDDIIVQWGASEILRGPQKASNMARANEVDGTVEIIGWSLLVGGGLRRRYLIRDVSGSGEIKLRTLLDMHRTWNLRFAEGMMEASRNRWDPMRKRTGW